ncbi:MAG: ankyrin repeat domain-containing protein [Acidobacteriota bacterium]
MNKQKAYGKFFKKMRGYGMFKGMICDNIGEYNYPRLYNESWNRKIIVLIVLAIIFSFILWKFPPPEYKINFNKKFSGLVERIDKFGMTNLHRAVIAGKIRIIRKLLKYNVNVNKTDDYGWSPLHWAFFLNKSEIKKILIDNGAREDIGSTRDWFIYKEGTCPADIK